MVGTPITMDKLIKYRIERKFYTEDHSLNVLKTFILSNSLGYKTAYKARKVNSIYYDDLYLSSFFDNEEGNRDRIKVRYRWYNDDYEKGVFEEKIKSNSFGYKRYYENGNSLIKSNIETKYLKPILKTSYHREYFENFNQSIRVTLDTNITYTSLSKYLTYKKYVERGIVIEVKYSPEQELKVERFISRLGLTITKFSKYSRGIKSLS